MAFTNGFHHSWAWDLVNFAAKYILKPMCPMGYNWVTKNMITPKAEDYKKIQGNIMDYMEVHMSVCGSGCSCPCKQTSSISVSKHLISAGMCGCNCTCGCNCNAPVMQNRFSDQRRTINC